MRVIFVLNIPLTADKTWLINKSMEYEEDFNDFYFGQFLTSIEYVFYFYFMSTGHHKLLLNSKSHIMILKKNYSILFHKNNIRIQVWNALVCINYDGHVSVNT